MNVRIFKADEENIWRTFWQAYNEDDLAKVNKSLMEENWRKILSDQSTLHAYWLQDDTGHPTGFVHFLMYECTSAKTGCCYVEDLFVYPKHRQKGCARILMNAVFQSARDKLIEKVYWITREQNKEAQYLYDQLAQKTDWIRYEVDLKVEETDAKE